MKNISIFLTSILFSLNSFGQIYDWTINFDNSNYINNLFIDTITNSHNVWAIGIPNKQIFNSAYSPPRAIITDSLNAYPINDTSSYTIYYIENTDGGLYNNCCAVSLTGFYQVNSDTLRDFGKIEFSPNNGITWIDLINDTAYASYIDFGSPPARPILTGNSNGWQYFSIIFPGLGGLFNIQDGDTILYRFTFISDSIQSNKDGLMFDDLIFNDWAEDISEIKKDNLISISPNPATNELRIYRTNTSDKERIQIMNYTGLTLFDISHFTGESIDIRELRNGIYLLKYSNSYFFSNKYFVVQH